MSVVPSLSKVGRLAGYEKYRCFKFGFFQYSIRNICTFLPILFYLDQICWATSMPFASIYPTYPRPSQWNFCQNIVRTGGAWKWHFVLFFVIGVFQKKCFCVFSMKITMAFVYSRFYFCTMDGFFRILKKGFVRTKSNTRTTVRL